LYFRLCHVGFTADAKAGLHLSLVYFSNILGSAAGTLITGFILMDRISTPQISAFLTALGAIAAAAVSRLAPMSWSRRAIFVLGCIVVAVGSPFAIKALFNHYYERIIQGSGRKRTSIGDKETTIYPWGIPIDFSYHRCTEVNRKWTEKKNNGADNQFATGQITNQRVDGTAVESPRIIKQAHGDGASI
jgi:hypothetical protein